MTSNERPAIEQLRAWKEDYVTQFIFTEIDIGTQEVIKRGVEHLQSTERVAHTAIYQQAFMDGLNAMRSALDDEINFLAAKQKDDDTAKDDGYSPYLSKRFYRSKK